MIQLMPLPLVVPLPDDTYNSPYLFTQPHDPDSTSGLDAYSPTGSTDDIDADDSPFLFTRTPSDADAYFSDAETPPASGSALSRCAPLPEPYDIEMLGSGAMDSDSHSNTLFDPFFAADVDGERFDV